MSFKWAEVITRILTTSIIDADVQFANKGNNATPKDWVQVKTFFNFNVKVGIKLKYS